MKQISSAMILLCQFQCLFLTEYIWSQEEHRNMGPWFFVNPRFNNLVGCKVSKSPVPSLVRYLSACSKNVSKICAL